MPKFEPPMNTDISSSIFPHHQGALAHPRSGARGQGTGARLPFIGVYRCLSVFIGG